VTLTGLHVSHLGVGSTIKALLLSPFLAFFELSAGRRIALRGRVSSTFFPLSLLLGSGEIFPVLESLFPPVRPMVPPPRDAEELFLR